MSEPSVIRLGIVGGMRGGGFRRAIAHLAHRTILAAIVDPDPQVRSAWQSQIPRIPAFADLEACLSADCCDAMLVATPMSLHAEQSIRAMKCGKHVLCEVPACLSHGEALQLIDAAQRSGAVFMMAENLNYMRAQMMVLNMVQQGALGEITYTEGAYLHDCRDLYFLPDGSLTWRGLVHGREPAGGNTYPTHPFGPIAWWLDIGRSDQIESVYSLTSPGLANARYTAERFGPAHQGARPEFWRRGDSTSCLIRTRMGRVIHIRSDMSSPRPMHNKAFEIQGTIGCIRSGLAKEDPPLCWLETMHPPRDQPSDQPERHWRPLYDHADRFEHPLWRQHATAALDCGHDGSDFLVLKEFIDAAQRRIPSPIDVYDAVTWSSLVWLSGESERLGAPVAAFDYRAASAAGNARG